MCILGETIPTNIRCSEYRKRQKYTKQSVGSRLIKAIGALIDGVGYSVIFAAVYSIFSYALTNGKDSAVFFPLSHGVPRVDDRHVISGIIYVIPNGLPWKDAPKAYGPHKTLYNRCVR